MGNELSLLDDRPLPPGSRDIPSPPGGDLVRRDDPLRILIRNGAGHGLLRDHVTFRRSERFYHLYYLLLNLLCLTIVPGSPRPYLFFFSPAEGGQRG